MAFENFSARDWGAFYRAINDGLPPEKCGLKLSNEERKAYIEDAEKLEDERKKNPGIPISYQDTFELEWK